MCKLFQECRRGNILIGTLRLDKDVRFKRSKAIIKYTTGHCCSKIYLLLAPLSLFRFLHFICLFLARGEKKSHLHQTKLWWAALSVQKTWGFDSSHSMVINYFSTVVGPALPAWCCSGSDGGWRQHMISAALITGLTGKRPRQHRANTRQSHTLCGMGPGKISRYMVFVYSSVRNGKVRCCQVCVWCWVK